MLSSRNADGRHGDTAALGAAQRDQLVAFLKAIDASEPGPGGGFALALASPAAGSAVGPGQPLAFGIATDLLDVDAVDYLVAGEVVATAATPPWAAAWTVDREGAVEVHALVHHAGRHRSLSPAMAVTLLPAAIFGSGFEP